jgi:hypothetical protein
MIDESIFFRSSPWIYQGVEDVLRIMRRLTVLHVLVDRYTAETRTKQGDFEVKRMRFEREYKELFARMQVKWGPYGNSNPPVDVFSTKMSR